MENSEKLTMQKKHNMPKLKMLEVAGERKPVKFDEDKGTEVVIGVPTSSWARQDTAVKLTNAKVL